MGFCIEVSGDFACFTRPEMKVERVSYDVITPSAARAIFESILWKPAMRWRINKIEVLKPISWINLRRNELGSVISERNVKSAMNGNGGPLMLNIEDDRQQRAGLFLRDVAYRLHADFEVVDDRHHQHNYPKLMCSDSGVSGNHYVKFAEMFKRRARKGQCFNQPYLGTREFSAQVNWVESGAELKPAIEQDKELGWMLYDLDYSDLKNPRPRFYQAVMKQGVIEVPAAESAGVAG